jgi:hypothetical protein
VKFNNLLNNFSAGEWSPKMRGRSEVAQYFQSCELLENFLPKIYGGAFRRPGTVRADLNDATLTGYLQNAKSTRSLLNGPAQVKSKMIPRVLSNGTKQFLVATNSAPSTWVVVNSSNTSGTAIGSISSGAAYTTAVASLKFTQIGDIVFIVDGTGANPPRIWTPETYTGGQLKLMTDYETDTPWKVYPYLPPKANSSNLSITASGTTGAITLTSSITWFSASHEGSYWKFSSGGVTGVAKITAYNSGTSLAATVIVTLPGAIAYGMAAGTSFEEQAWSDYQGWPKTITSHQGRVVYGGNSRNPDTLWGSRIGNVFDMMERPFEQYTDDFEAYPQDNSRPFTLTPNSKEASNIRALSSDKTLLIHTDRSEIVGFGTNGALGPLDVTFESSTSFGANAPLPVRANNYAIFVQKGGRKLRDVIFNFEQDQYKSNDLTFASDHMTLDPEEFEATNVYNNGYYDPIVEIVAQTTDSSYVWAKTQNGRLLALALDRDYQMNGWARIRLGGASNEKSFPLVKSMCVIDGDSGEGDRLWMLVQRTADGADVVHLEYLDIPYEFDDFETTYASGQHFRNHYIHLDHKSRYIKGALNRIYSLDHLKGQTVQAVANGVYLGEYVVGSDGEIAITGAPSLDDGTNYNITVGLPASAMLKTMPIELGQQVPGTPQGFIKRVDQMLIKFYLSKACKYGYKTNDMLSFDFSEVPAGELFTGIKEVRFPSDYSRECQVIVKADTPWPCNLTSVIAKGMLYD